MIRSKINKQYDFLIEKCKEHFLINGVYKEFDIRRLDKTNYHIIHNNQSFRICFKEYDIFRKWFEVEINGNTYHVTLQDESDLLLENVGINKAAVERTFELKAPMPGLIVDIHVREGEKVKAGDSLIVLKAMKMENVLKASRDGQIKRILVTKSQKIEKDTVMLQF